MKMAPILPRDQSELETDKLNFIKFCSVVIGLFPHVLRQVFEQMWNKIRQRPWNDSDEVRNLFLEGEGGKTNVPTENSFTEWNSTALFEATLFAKMFGKPDGNGGHRTMKQLYVKCEPSPGAFHARIGGDFRPESETFALALDQLRLLRNALCYHINEQKIPKLKFDVYLDRTKEAFKALHQGNSVASLVDIENLTTRDFPSERFQRLVNDLTREKGSAIRFGQMRPIDYENVKPGEANMKKVMGDIGSGVRGVRSYVERKLNERRSDLNNKNIENIVNETNTNVHYSNEGATGIRSDEKGVNIVQTSVEASKNPEDSGSDTNDVNLKSVPLDKKEKLEEDAVHLKTEARKATANIESAVTDTRDNKIEASSVQTSRPEVQHKKSPRFTDMENACTIDCKGVRPRFPDVPTKVHRAVGASEDTKTLEITPERRNLGETESNEASSVKSKARYFEAKLNDQKPNANDKDLKIGVSLKTKNLNTGTKDAETSIENVTQSDAKHAGVDVEKKWQNFESNKRNVETGKINVKTRAENVFSGEKNVSRTQRSDLPLPAARNKRTDPPLPAARKKVGSDDSVVDKVKEASVDKKEYEESTDDNRNGETGKINAMIKKAENVLSGEKDVSRTQRTDLPLPAARNKRTDPPLPAARKKIETDDSVVDEVKEASVDKKEHEESTDDNRSGETGKINVMTKKAENVLSGEKDVSRTQRSDLPLPAARNKRTDPPLPAARKKKGTDDSVVDEVKGASVDKKKHEEPTDEKLKGPSVMRPLSTESKTPVSYGTAGTVGSSTSFFDLACTFLKVSDKTSEGFQEGSSGDLIDKQIMAYSYHNIGVQQINMKDFDGALESLQKAWELGGEHSSDDTQPANTLVAIGAVYLMRGDNGLAVESLQKAADSLSNLDHKKTAKVCFLLGIAQRRNGDVTEALESLQRASRLQKELLGDHSTTAESFQELGSVCSQLGDDVSAIEAFQEAAEMRSKVLGDHEDTADSYYCLGSAQLSKADYTEAQNSFKRASKMYEEMKGDDIDTARSFNELGIVCLRLGNDTSAVEAFQKAAEMRSKVLGDHEDTAYSYYCLGSAQLSKADYSEAQNSFKRASKMYEEMKGDDIDTARSFNELGIVCLRLGNDTSAVEAFQKAVDIKSKVLGDHKDTAKSYMNLGAAQLQEGDCNKALHSLQKASQLYEKILGDSPKTATSFHELGLAYLRLDDHSSASESLKVAAEMRSKVLGDNEATAYSYHLLGLAQFKRKDFSAALHSVQKESMINEKIKGDHIVTAASFHLLGRVYLEMNDGKAAVEALQKAASMRSKVSADHEDTADSYFLLGTAQQETGDLTGS
ncbi:uncharacterized protein [Montipora capricornis]|uniref:uncharacterized protein n=1 Tax=Montipora capricornis TaxID=246305 RepID=UPI0035F17ADD